MAAPITPMPIQPTRVWAEVMGFGYGVPAIDERVETETQSNSSGRGRLLSQNVLELQFISSIFFCLFICYFLFIEHFP